MPSRVAIDDPDGPSSHKAPPETAAAARGAAEDDAPDPNHTSDDADADIVDPEHAAFTALVRSIVALCIQKKQTGRDDVEKMVRKYRGRYPQLSVRHIAEGIDEKLGRKDEDGEGSDEFQVVKRALHLFCTENEKAPPSTKVAVTAGTLQARAILARDVVLQQRRQNGGDGGVLENFHPTVDWVRGAADEYGWTLSDVDGSAKEPAEGDAGQKGVDDSRASEGTANNIVGDNDHLQSIKRALHLFYTENEKAPPEKRVEVTLTALEARAILAKELVLERHRREGTVDEDALRTLEHTPITQTWLRETATEYGWTLSDPDAARNEHERAATLQRHANRLCTVEGCTRYRISDGVCRDHGGKRTRYRKPCSVEGCASTGYARLGGVCQRHFALGHGDQEGKGKATPRTRRKCEYEGCDAWPEGRAGERWLCRHHGGPKRKRRKRPPCTVEGCSNVSQIGGVCRSHGARQWTKTCKVEGCESKVSTMYRLGFCYRHLPHDQKERCTAEGCTFLARKNGVCRTHGAEVPLCTVEGCEKVRTSKSFCYRHSGKKYVARPCSVAGCTNQSQRKGLCVRHGGRKRCSTTGCEKQVVRGGLCISCGKYGPHGKKKRKHSEVSKEVAQLLHEAGVEQSAEESEKGAKANDAQEKGREPTKGASAQRVAQTSTPQTTMFPNLSQEQRSEMATRFQQLMGPNQMPFPVPMMVPYQPFWYTGPPPPFGNALAAQAMWAHHSNPSNSLWQKSNQFSKGNEGAESSANNPGNAAPAANHATDGRKQSPAPAHDETASKIDAFLRLRRCNP